jgi:hypothetical protein
LRQLGMCVRLDRDFFLPDDRGGHVAI